MLHDRAPRESARCARLVVVGAACIASACQRTPNSTGAPLASAAPALASSAQSAVLELGQTAKLPSYRVRLVSQRECNKPGPTPSRGALRSWAAELEVTNASQELVPVNPFYATLQDDDRFGYTTSLADCGTLLPSKLLQPSETVRGFVPFELPRTTVSVTLTYRPFLRGNVEQSAHFHLDL